jgi:hypothetical protein
MLQSYARYYNEIRTHQSLNDDAPLTRPVQRSGHIVSHTQLRQLPSIAPVVAYFALSYG